MRVDRRAATTVTVTSTVTVTARQRPRCQWSGSVVRQIAQRCHSTSSPTPPPTSPSFVHSHRDSPSRRAGPP